MFAIRPYHPSDLTALYRICLQTADNGNDATHLYADPDLLGHFYAAPYAVLEPDLCFVLTAADVPVGYVLGTRDSAAFYTACENNWFAPLRKRYPLPDPADKTADASLIRALHRGHTPNTDIIAAYPAHLHIDILPAGQGAGGGRQLIMQLVGRLRSLGVAGLHLEVSNSNPNAIGFYQHVGFTLLSQNKYTHIFGMALSDS